MKRMKILCVEVDMHRAIKLACDALNGYKLLIV